MTYTTLATRHLSMKAKFWSTVNVLTVINAATLEKTPLVAETVEAGEEVIETEIIVVDAVVRMLTVIKVQELKEKTLMVAEETMRVEVKRIKEHQPQLETNQ